MTLGQRHGRAGVIWRGALLLMLGGFLTVAAGAQAAGPRVVTGAAPVTAAVATDDLPLTRLRVVGGLGNTSQYHNIEEPFWTNRLAELSHGRITAEVTPSDGLGIRSSDMIMLMRLGVIPFGTASLALIAGEDAQAAAIDLPGLNPDIATLRRHAAAYRDSLAAVYRERYNIELLALWTYPAQVLFCNQPITGLGSLAGKRVRTASALHADFVEALGAIGVTLPFNQMVDALRRHAVDCAVTGTLSGNFQKLYEVTTHLYPLPISWGPNIFAANLSAWRRLPEEVRSFLRKQLEGLEEEIWARAEYETEQGISCNVGRPDCKLGVPAHMVEVPVQAKDRQLARKILQDVIIRRWADRCGDECVEQWEDTIGVLAGLK